MANDAEVAVIGAGAAGLAAAHALARKGIDVVVLEARDRLFGRVHTIQDRELGIPLELGAEFVHGRPKPVFKRAKKHRLHLDDADGEHLVSFRDRVHGGDDTFEEAMAAFGQAGLEREESIGSYLDRLDLGRETRAMARAFVEGFYVADLARTSARFIGEMARAAEKIDGERLGRVREGYDALLRTWAAPLGPRIRLNTRVDAVKYRRHSVALSLSHPLTGRYAGSVSCARVVVTLPVPLLADRRAFPITPEPTELRLAAKKLENGGVVKAVLVFRERFWKGDFAFVHDADQPFPTFWRPVPFDAPVFVAWAGGPEAERLSGRRQEPIVDAALESLAHMLKLSRALVEARLQRAVVADWLADPFSRGAYCVVPVGQMRAFEVLRAPVDDTLFFAGEATAGGDAGTVAGALASGERAAREVRASLRR